MKEIRYKAALYSIFGMVGITLCLVTADFVKARWEHYNAPTGTYERNYLWVREKFNDDLELIDTDTIDFYYQTHHLYWDRKYRINVYTEITERKIRRK